MQKGTVLKYVTDQNAIPGFKQQNQTTRKLRLQIMKINQNAVLT